MSNIPDEFMKAAEASLSIQPSRVAFPRSDVVLLMARALMAAAEALEEAAKWHEAEIERLEDQIEHNNEYARRSGNFDGEANDFCRSLISNHRSGAAAIRALGEKAG